MTKAAAATCGSFSRPRQQQLGERLQPGLLCNLGLCAALRLERKIDVLQAALAVRREDRRFERGVQLALLANRIEDGGATLLELAQIGQALFQRAQLRVVESAGRFLAVARNERHRGATVEQRDRRLDLLFADAEFFGDLSIDVDHATSLMPPRLADSDGGKRLMDYRQSVHQPATQIKLICGWGVAVSNCLRCHSRELRKGCRQIG